jgi:hypothetical protein
MGLQSMWMVLTLFTSMARGMVKTETLVYHTSVLLEELDPTAELMRKFAGKTKQGKTKQGKNKTRQKQNKAKTTQGTNKTGDAALHCVFGASKPALLQLQICSRAFHAAAEKGRVSLIVSSQTQPAVAAHAEPVRFKAHQPISC